MKIFLLCFLAVIMTGCVTKSKKKRKVKYLPYEEIANLGAPPVADLSTAVWTGKEMLLWGGLPRDGSPRANTGAAYNPANNAWRTITDAYAPHLRSGHSAIWTGSDMIVWGGKSLRRDDRLNSGGLFNPRTNAWDPTTLKDAPQPRSEHTAVWIEPARKMIIWGGEGDTVLFGDGGEYDPENNSWTKIPGNVIPINPDSEEKDPLKAFKQKNKGEEDQRLAESERYSRIYDQLTDEEAEKAADISAPLPRSNHRAISIGKEMMIWGGLGDQTQGPLGDGARYDPDTKIWTPVSKEDAPSPRYGHSMTWTGEKVIVWGGWNNRRHLRSGAIYDPKEDEWLPISRRGAPSPRTLHTAVYLDGKLIIYGGLGRNRRILADGGIYDLEEEEWTKLKLKGDTSPRYLHHVINTGATMLIWGGRAGDWKMAQDPGLNVPLRGVIGRRAYKKALRKLKRGSKKKHRSKRPSEGDKNNANSEDNALDDTPPPDEEAPFGMHSLEGL